MANEAWIIDAVRTPVGKRGGSLAGEHPADLGAHVIASLVERTGVEPERYDDVIFGCVDTLGPQAGDIARTAWLAAGLPMHVPGVTIDRQCGSSQQATNMAYAMVKAGVVDAAVGCGVEVMSRIPIGSNSSKKLGLGIPIPKPYFGEYEMTSQFEGAERIADKWGVTRSDADEFGLRSQMLAAQAWEEARFATQIVPIDAPDLDDDGKPTGTSHRVERDEGLRDTTMEGLAALKPVAREDGVHTAGSSSQISDGAAAVLVMTAEKAEALGLAPKAKIIDTCLVGVDPVLMLTGPIDATKHLLERTGMSIGDVDLVEINEAFASVVLAWQRELDVNPDIVNPNGGAIALGHPLGGTGAFLMTKAVHELERADKSTALITMCCGGGLGTGTLIERI